MRQGITPIGRARFYLLLACAAMAAALFGLLISRIDPGGWVTGAKTGAIVFGVAFIGFRLIAQQRVGERSKGEKDAQSPNGRQHHH